MPLEGKVHKTISTGEFPKTVLSPATDLCERCYGFRDCCGSLWSLTSGGQARLFQNGLPNGTFRTLFKGTNLECHPNKGNDWWQSHKEVNKILKSFWWFCWENFISLDNFSICISALVEFQLSSDLIKQLLGCLLYGKRYCLERPRRL